MSVLYKNLCNNCVIKGLQCMVRNFPTAWGLLILGKYHLSHQNWKDKVRSKRTRSQFQIVRLKIITNISVIAMTFIIAH